ncbi:MAG: OsmC family protein [Aestuariibaculum sp.]
MSKIHYYEVNLQWKKGRIGELSSPVLNTTIECATPPEFSNGVPNIWSPEHLYAAAINSCFMTTFLAIAENFKLPFVNFSCKTTCKLEIVDRKYMISEATIAPNLILKDKETDWDKTVKVLEKTKAACLVTNSMKTEILLVPNIL